MLICQYVLMMPAAKKELIKIQREDKKTKCENVNYFSWFILAMKR